MNWVGAFFACGLGALFSNLIYPCVLFVIPRRRKAAEPEFKTVTQPRVTLVVACRNEEQRIEVKLRNSLAIQYPNLEILIASDASDDLSDGIVGRFSECGVRLVRSPERRGKEHAQRLAIEQSIGEIIVFSDASTEIPPGSIQLIVGRFQDSRIGAVSSEDRFVSTDGRVAGEGAYVRYEMWLRRLESDVNSLVGLSGSFFAVRRSIAEPWDDSIPSDFACAINTIRLGQVAVSDPRVVGIYKDISDPRLEFDRKVRTALRGMGAIARIPEVLNPFRYGLFAFQVWGHKVMRWLVPWFLLGLILSNAMLVRSGRAFTVLFLLQCAAYGVAAIAHWVPSIKSNVLVRLGYYFMQANAAVMLAGIKFLAGTRVVTWTPSVR